LVKMVKHKTLKKIQKIVDEWINQFKEGYWHPLAQLARLTEELGELARVINHLYGEKPKKVAEKKQTLEEEIGDLLFTLICLANAQNVDLAETLDKVMEKLNKRDGTRWTKKKS
jgi:NTP pyrophosphatase (non-canonical NTP hydrolase)